MATKVFTTEELELQDGTMVTVKPLTIKRLRKFMNVIAQLNNTEGVAEDEDEEERAIDLMFDACVIALEQNNPKVIEDRDNLEDALDIPTMWKILEVAGGIEMGNAMGPVRGLAGTS